MKEKLLVLCGTIGHVRHCTTTPIVAVCATSAADVDVKAKKFDKTNAALDKRFEVSKF